MITIAIKENNKDADLIEVEHFNAEEVLKKMTDREERGNRVNEFLDFGNNIYSIISIQSIKKVDRNEETYEAPPQKLDQKSNFWRSLFLWQNTVLNLN